MRALTPAIWAASRPASTLIVPRITFYHHRGGAAAGATRVAPAAEDAGLVGVDAEANAMGGHQVGSSPESGDPVHLGQQQLNGGLHAASGGDLHCSRCRQPLRPVNRRDEPDAPSGLFA